MVRQVKKLRGSGWIIFKSKIQIVKYQVDKHKI